MLQKSSAGPYGNTCVGVQIGRLDTGKVQEKGKPRKASNIVTAREEKVQLRAVLRSSLEMTAVCK